MSNVQQSSTHLPTYFFFSTFFIYKVPKLYNNYCMTKKPEDFSWLNYQMLIVCVFLLLENFIVFK